VTMAAMSSSWLLTKTILGQCKTIAFPQITCGKLPSVWCGTANPTNTNCPIDAHGSCPSSSTQPRSCTAGVDALTCNQWTRRCHQGQKTSYWRCTYTWLLGCNAVFLGTYTAVCPSFVAGWGAIGMGPPTVKTFPLATLTNPCPGA